MSGPIDATELVEPFVAVAVAHEASTSGSQRRMWHKNCYLELWRRKRR
jgi:hypothetical protein